MLSQSVFGVLDIELAFIPAHHYTAAVMGAFEDKLIGQHVKIYLFRTVPRSADKGDKILLAYLFGNVYKGLRS